MRESNLGKLDQENTEALSAQATILDPKISYTIEDKHVSITSVTCRKKHDLCFKTQDFLAK